MFYIGNIGKKTCWRRLNQLQKRITIFYRYNKESPPNSKKSNCSKDLKG